MADADKKGAPDELIIVGLTTGTIVLTVLLVAVGLLSSYWNLQAQPDLYEEPAVEHHYGDDHH